MPPWVQFIVAFGAVWGIFAYVGLMVHITRHRKERNSNVKTDKI